MQSSMIIVFGCCAGILLLFTYLLYLGPLKKSKSVTELRGRTLTFWIMLVGFALGFSTHELVSFGFLFLIGVLAFREYQSFFLGQVPRAFFVANRVSEVLFFVMATLAYFNQWGLFSSLVFVFAGLLLPLFFVYGNQIEAVNDWMGRQILGFLFFFVMWGHGFFVLNQGVMVLAFCFVLTELRDLVSYWMGKFVAKKTTADSWMQFKIADRVSPHKTWFTGLVSVFFMGFLALLFVPLFPIFPRGQVSAEIIFGFGLMIGFFGMMGDLVFSLMKRDRGVKDSGTFLPGGTGVIDRIDSLILTIPVTYYCFQFFYF